MMFDANLTVLGFDVIAPETDDEGKLVNPEGAHVELQLVVGAAMPGPQGLMTLPLGVLRINLTGETALDKGQNLIDAGKLMPTKAKLPADFVVADRAGMESVVKQAEATKKMTKGKK